MRVSIVDPSAFTPPYDRSLAAALARAGVEVELVTSRFLYGPVPEPEGYEVRAPFYRSRPGSARTRGCGCPSRGSSTAPGCSVRAQPPRRRRHPLAVGDAACRRPLPRPPVARAGRGERRASSPCTIRCPTPGRRARSGAERASSPSSTRSSPTPSTAPAGCATEFGLDPAAVHVIPHGPLDYLPTHPEPAPLPAELAARRPDVPVVLFFGLLRPYKGIDTLLEAFAALERDRGRAVDRGDAADADRAAAAACAAGRAGQPSAGCPASSPTRRSRR